MKHRTAALGVSLVLGCAATGASAAVAYYPDGYVVYDPTPNVVRVERVSVPEVVTYNDRYVYYTTPETPRVVERYVSPRETVVVNAERMYVPSVPDSSQWNPRHPHWGHLIDHGLFNRTGPNDFGR